MQTEKVRVYALARELNLDSKALLAMCQQAGMDLKNQLSSLDTEQCEAIKLLVKRGQSAPAAKASATSAKPVLPVKDKVIHNLDTKRPAPRSAAAEAPSLPPPAPAAVAPVASAPAVEPPRPAAVEPPPAPKPAPPSTVAAEVKKPPVAPPSAPVVTTSEPRPQPAPPAKPATPPHAAPPAKPAVPPHAAPPHAAPPHAAPPHAAPPHAAPPHAAPTHVAASTPAPKPPQAPPPGSAVPGRPRPLPSGGGRVPVLGQPRSDKDGGAGRQAPRPPLRPTGAGPARASSPPPLRGRLAQQTQEKKPTEGPVQKPIATFTVTQLRDAQNRTLRAEDVLVRPSALPLPGTVVPEGGEAEKEEEDGKGKGKGKKTRGRDGKGVGDRDKRREERERRAIERKEHTTVPAALSEDDDETRPRKYGSHGRGALKVQAKPAAVRSNKVELVPPITVRVLSEALGMKAGDIVRKLMNQNMMLTINSTLTLELATEIAFEVGKELEIKRPPDAEEIFLREIQKIDEPDSLLPRAPIVTIMGHVDHGKTSLLDHIRRSNVVDTEAGGITQVIRAWRVDHGGRPITFLDTPGHEAFTKMRARGAQVTDIAVIVVAANDGVMPQTEEAINHAKAAKVSLVIAINKVDLPNANVERARRQLYTLGVLPDNMGGDTPFVETSATTGKGMEELLDTLSLVAELKELKANPNKPGRGTCLEAMLSEGEGVRATLIVQDGTLRRGDVILCGSASGRIRQMYDDLGRPLQEAGPSVPVRITGLDEAPNADDPFYVLDDPAVARDIADKRRMKRQEAALAPRLTLDFAKLTEVKMVELKIILKADFRGSVEAIRKELEKLKHAEVGVRVLHTGVGGITESDVQLALTSPQDTLILGFNVVPDDRALAMAEKTGVSIREYDIIYNLTNDIRSALEGKLRPREEVIHLGRAVVREIFKISRVGTIAGCYVTQGTIKRSAKIRVIRQGVVIYPPTDRTASLESLKRFKDDASEVREGFECGIKIAGYDDLKVDDVVEAYRVEEVQRTLE